jgi:NADPH-dependent ferric siderophore reductase
MNKYTYTYWTCTNPNAERSSLPDGKFTIWADCKSKKVVIHVTNNLVTRIESWKYTSMGYWGKGKADLVRIG